MYTHLNAEMEPRENNHHKVMVFYANYDDVEFGIKLDEKEVMEFGAGMASMLEDGSLMDLVEKLKSAFETKADDQEESEEPEEKATDEEKLRDEYISKIRDLGFKVEVEEEKEKEFESDSDPVRIHCRTYGNLDSVKFKIVKDYLRKNGIDMIKGISPTGRDEIDYYLWPHQVKELTDLINRDEDTYSDGKVII